MSDQLSADLASLRIARDAPPPPSGKGRVVVFALASLAAVGAVGFWGMNAARAQLFKTPVSTTEISLVSPMQASVDLTATGYVVPQVVAKVGAKVVGRIVKVNVREGDKVEAGQVLFEMDPSD